QWRQYEEIFPALARSRIDQVSIECRNARVPLDLLQLLKGKDVQLGVIDVASSAIETPEDVVTTLAAAAEYLPKERIIAGTNCGMAPMQFEIAMAKLAALGKGAQLARQRLGWTALPESGIAAPRLRITMFVTGRVLHHLELFAGGDVIGFVGEHVHERAARALLSPVHQLF